MNCYVNSDIIMCFPGIGRTFFTNGDKDTPSHSSFTLDKNFSGNDAARFVDEIFAIKVTRKYRYILIPMYVDIAKQLHESDVAFIIVCPREEDRDKWAKRWMKAGATAAEIGARLSDIDGIATFYSEYGTPIVRLDADEWLGNILDQTPIRVDEGNAE